MEINIELYNKIALFTEKFCFLDRDEIILSSRIEEDFGVTGDDAIEFLIAFGKQFNVYLSEFKAADYFNPEGTSIIILTHVPNKKTLRMIHLLKAAMVGKLNESVINSAD